MREYIRNTLALAIATAAFAVVITVGVDILSSAIISAHIPAGAGIDRTILLLHELQKTIACLMGGLIMLAAAIMFSVYRPSRTALFGRKRIAHGRLQANDM